MKYLILLIALLSLAACQEVNNDLQEAEVVESSLLAEDVIKDNPNINTGPIETREIPRIIKCTGHMDIPPTDMVSIHARAEGYITTLKVIPGDRVRKGSLIARIENPEFITRQRELLEVRAEYELAKKQLSRQNTLDEGGATTSRAVDQAAHNVKLLETRYFGLKNELAAIGFDIEGLEKDAQYQQSLSIYSPINGAVESVEVNSGQMIMPADRIAHIVSFDHFHIELQVLAKDVMHVSTGQKVEFTIPGSPKSYRAEIVKLSPSIDPDIGTLMAHCHVDDIELKFIIPGLFVNAEILGSTITGSGLPAEALVREGEIYSAYMVDGNEFVKVSFENVEIVDGFAFIDFPEGIEQATWVTAGAYYIE